MPCVARRPSNTGNKCDGKKKIKKCIGADKGFFEVDCDPPSMVHTNTHGWKQGGWSIQGGLCWLLALLFRGMGKLTSKYCLRTTRSIGHVAVGEGVHKDCEKKKQFTWCRFGEEYPTRTQGVTPRRAQWWHTPNEHSVISKNIVDLSQNQ